MNDAHSARADACAPEATGGLTRRDIAKIGAWAVPAVMMATALPAAAASGRYAGPAFQIIGAGAGDPNELKIYAVGPGPLRGTIDNLQPGVRFGWIGTTPAPAARIAHVTFQPKASVTEGPDPSKLFTTFGNLAISRTSDFEYTLSVGATAADPRHTFSNVNSFTLRTSADALGEYDIVDSGGKSGRFVITSTGSELNATELILQPEYP